MLHVLALIEPLAPGGAYRLPIRICSANRWELTGLGGEVWEPAMVEPPKVAFRLFGGEFGDGGAGASATRFSVAMQTVKKRWPDADRVDWAGAKLTLYSGRAGQAWPWDVLMVARVTSFSRRNETLTLSAASDAGPFEKRIPSETYAGTTGAEGPADLKGTVKPLVIGHARNVEPILIDPVNNVYQISAYGPIEAVEGLFERGSDFGASLGDSADYAALVAAAIPEGRWGTCLAEGLVRLGAPAFGVITADVRGHEVSGATPRLHGDIVRELVNLAGVDSDLVDFETLDAMDLAKAMNASLVLTQSASVLSVVQDLVAEVNHVAGIGLDGRLFTDPIAIIPATTITLDAQGKAWPQVSASSENNTSPPYSKIELGAERNWRVQGPEELAYQGDIIDTGDYDNTRWYREGNIVALSDKRRFIYSNATPSSGNAPPDPTYWDPLEGEITYQDGTPLETLKPAEPNSDVTANSQITLSAVAPITIQADSSNITTTTLPITRDLSLLRGGVELTSGVTVGTLTVPAGMAASASVAAGVVTVSLTQADVAGTILVPVTYNSITYVFEIPVTRTMASGPTGGTGSGSTSFTDDTLSDVSSSTFVQISNSGAQVETDSNGDLRFIFSAQFTGDGTTNCEAIARWSDDGWATSNDVGTATAGTPGFDEFEPGLINFNILDTSLAASTVLDVALFARRTAGTSPVEWQFEFFQVKQP